MLRKTLSIAAVLILLLNVVSAQEAKPADPAKPKVNYQEHIQSIFREHCYTCHSADQAKSGLALDTYAATMRGGSGGEVIFGGDLDSSRLWALTAHIETPKMPPEQDKLPEPKLNLIKQWILDGALENSGSKAKIVKKPTFELKVTSGSNKPSGPAAMPEGMIPEPAVVTSRPGAITALAASPWAPLIALSGQKQVLLYHADTLELLGVLPFPEGTPHVLKFSRNGSLLLAAGGRGGQAGRVILFDVKTGKRVAEVGDELDVVLAADVNNDHTLVALGGPRKVIRIYSIEDGTLASESRKHTDWIYSVEFSPDGVLLASGDRSGGLFVWESDTGREFHNLTGHKAGVTDVSWRIDSNVLASSSEDGTIKLWEMDNGREIKSWNAHDGAGVLGVEFAANGNLASVGRNKITRVWKQDGSQLKSFDAFGGLAMEVAVLNDGKRVVAGDLNGDVKIWNIEDGKQLGSLRANPPTIAGMVDLETTHLAAHEKAVTDATAGKKAADDRLTAVTNEINAANKAADDAKRLEGDRAKMDQQLAQAQAAAKQTADALKPLQADLKRQQTELTQLTATALQKADALKQLQTKPDADKGAVEKAKKESEDATAAVAAKQASIKVVEGKVTATTAEVAKTEAARAAAEKTRSDWAAALNAAKQASKSKTDLDKLVAARTEAEKGVATSAAALETAKTQATSTKVRLERVKQLKALQDKTRNATASK